jgi:hypothetical protein
MNATMQSSLKWIPVGLLVTLAACSSTGCDPARAGFLEGMNCSGGGYQQRQAFLDQGLAQAQANALEKAIEARQAADNAAAAQRTLAARQEEMAKYDQRLAELRRRLRVAGARDNADSEAIRRITLQLAELAHQQDTVRSNPTQIDLTAIRTRQQRVVKMLDDLD